jgi:4-aminobutyrate aminotransferase/(S)-3-amino-2-methylpropionate transaminase
MSASIRLKTTIPGPRSQELAARRDRAVPKGIGHSTPIYAASASGALVTDVDGNVFIDFAGGIGTLNVGHANPGVVRAAADQLGKAPHTCFSVAPYEPYVALAETLAADAGRLREEDHAHNSGAEALENAVKIARHATGREAVASSARVPRANPHTLSMTSKSVPTSSAGPFAPEVTGCPSLRVPRALRRARRGRGPAGRVLPPRWRRKVACVVLELVRRAASSSRRRTTWTRSPVLPGHGILPVIDEADRVRAHRPPVRLRALRSPDLIAMAKSARRRPAHLGGHGTGGGRSASRRPRRTHVGPRLLRGGAGRRGLHREPPLGAERRDGRERAQCFRALPSWETRGPRRDARARAVRDKKTKEPDKERTDRVLRGAYERGLLLVTAGTYGNVLRTLMPLVITDGALTEGLDVLEKALESA